MPLHFAPEEYAARRAKVCADLADAGLQGLLMFRQESMFYLTGYDTFGYVFFQCLYLGADGRLVLLTRSPDLRQAQQTSTIEDIRIWVDAPDAEPALDLRAILEADQAYDAAIETTAPGAFEGDILAAMQGSIFRGGGDYPGNEFIIGSGPGALLCRYYSGRREMDPEDQLTLEWAGAYRHYHAAMMRTFRVGKPPARQAEMYAVGCDALQAVEAELRPGNTYGTAFDAHARTLDAAGYRAHRLNACGYSLGTCFSPNWMDWPMLYHGNPAVIAAGMTIFVHIIIFDSERGLAASVGRTSLVTDGGAESLSRAPLDFVTL